MFCATLPLVLLLVHEHVRNPVLSALVVAEELGAG